MKDKTKIIQQELYLALDCEGKFIVASWETDANEHSISLGKVTVSFPVPILQPADLNRRFIKALEDKREQVQIEAKQKESQILEIIQKFRAISYTPVDELK